MRASFPPFAKNAKDGAPDHERRVKSYKLFRAAEGGSLKQSLLLLKVDRCRL